MIIDSHSHLDMPQFDTDRDDVIRRAREAGLGLMVCIGTGNPAESSIEKTLALAERYDFIYAGLGIHPHDARLPDAGYWRKVEQWMEHPKVVLWGEIGLDYYYDHSPREIQKAVFRRQLRMAHERRMPVAVHCRDAWPDLAGIVREEWPDDRPGGILHSFAGDRKQALEGVDLGFLISFSGMVTFKNADALRAAARALSLDRILVESDCPYLAPVPHRGKRNEPSFVVDVGMHLAGTLQVDYTELARRTSTNFRRLTGMAQAGVSGAGDGAAFS
jgi:TatD DNase family protein